MIPLIQGPLIDKINDYDVVLFGMGINNSMNNGFARQLKVNYPEITIQEQETKYGDRNKYGTIKIIYTENKIFCACYFYKGGFTKKIEPDQVDYDSLCNCLKEVKHWFKNKTIASPILGISDYDGNGDRNRILNIYNDIFDDTNNLTLFDFEQFDYDKYYFKQILDIRTLKKTHQIDKLEYIQKRSDIEWERLYGIKNKRPEYWVYHPKIKNKQIIKVNKIKYNG